MLCRKETTGERTMTKRRDLPAGDWTACQRAARRAQTEELARLASVAAAAVSAYCARLFSGVTRAPRLSPRH